MEKSNADKRYSWRVTHCLGLSPEYPPRRHIPHIIPFKSLTCPILKQGIQSPVQSNTAVKDRSWEPNPGSPTPETSSFFNTQEQPGFPLDT